jgi:cyclopropane fatty-acyl-phospholipid synthase-like methyltransferase
MVEEMGYHNMDDHFKRGREVLFKKGKKLMRNQRQKNEKDYVLTRIEVRSGNWMDKSKLDLISRALRMQSFNEINSTTQHVVVPHRLIFGRAPAAVATHSG